MHFSLVDSDVDVRFAIFQLLYRLPDIQRQCLKHRFDCVRVVP